VRRRDFLLGGAGLAAAAAGLWLWRRGGERSTPAPATEARILGGVMPAAELPLLLALADAVVPRDGSQPAASEIDLLPRLERWITASPGRMRLYVAGWPPLASELRRRFGRQATDPQALEPLLESWYREFRDGTTGAAAHFFEQVRRDVLRAYWSSPAGWSAVGYTGPAHLAAPPGAIAPASRVAPAAGAAGA
jgi:hypothetical protein